MPPTAVLVTTPPFTPTAEGFLLLLGIAGGMGAFLRSGPGAAALFEPSPLALAFLLGFDLPGPEEDA